MNKKELFELFFTGSEYQSDRSISKGNIHETLLVDCKDHRKFILQKLNTYVFRDPEALMANALLLSSHLKEKQTKANLTWSFPCFHKTIKDEYLLKQDNGEYWRLMDFIEHDSNPALNTDIYHIAGSSYGGFISLLSDLSPDLIKETIPDFHNLGSRMKTFREVVKSSDSNFLSNSEAEIEFIFSREESHSKLFNLQEDGIFPKRLTHNDTKIDNILFDNYGKPKAIIDLDTVMPGIVHSDFGDAIRSFANTAAEDENDLNLVNFKLEVFTRYAAGFITALKSILTESEKESLALAPFMWTYMQAVRFLNDYLDGSKYYKINYPEHNLVRARNQIKLLKSMEDQFSEMETIIHEELNKNS